MEITKLEKAALITTGAAAAYKTLLWSLELPIDAGGGWALSLRILFALLSFAAFDLVLMAVIARGWSVSGAIALIIAAGVSGIIGLSVGKAAAIPELHAAPALTLAAFGLHLMLRRPAPAESAPPAITQAVQVNVGQQLPRTIAGFIAARHAERPDRPHHELASELGTNEAIVQKALALAPAVSEQEATQ